MFSQALNDESMNTDGKNLKVKIRKLFLREENRNAEKKRVRKFSFIYLEKKERILCIKKNQIQKKFLKVDRNQSISK